MFMSKTQKYLIYFNLLHCLDCSSVVGARCHVFKMQLTQRLFPSNTDLDVDYHGNSKNFEKCRVNPTI